MQKELSPLSRGPPEYSTPQAPPHGFCNAIRCRQYGVLQNIGGRQRDVRRCDTDWRTIEVEVSGPRVRVFWDRKTLVKEFDEAAIVAKVRDKVRWLEKPHRNHPAIRGLGTDIDLRGAVGLYICRGYASFRQVRITPLTNADGTIGK